MKKINLILSMALSLASVAALAQGDRYRTDFVTDLIVRDAGLDNTKSAQLVSEVSQVVDGFEYVNVTLNHPQSGQIRLLIKGPLGFRQSSQAFKTIFLVSGFFTGQESVRLLGDIKTAVVVGFQYPYGVSDFEREPQKVIEFVRRTPAQIALTMRWLADQLWTNPRYTAAVGVSLGGLFLPSSLYLAQRLNAGASHTVFVCTGADLRLIVRANQSPMPAEAGALLSNVIAELASPLDPRMYLPYLQGNFLALRTAQDQVIPEASSLELESLLPQPIQTEIFPGPHINQDQTATIELVKQSIARWLGL